MLNIGGQRTLTDKMATRFFIKTRINESGSFPYIVEIDENLSFRKKHILPDLDNIRFFTRNFEILSDNQTILLPVRGEILRMNQK